MTTTHPATEGPQGESLPIVGDGDWPVENLDGDRLGRAPFARELAEEILSAPVAGGYVMGLTGPWGVGKSSILNMTVDALGDRAHVVQFNPWLFSGTEALVGAFFAEIARQLDSGSGILRTVAQKLSTYGRLVSPIAAMAGLGGAVDTATGLLAQVATGPSVLEQRADLREQLATLPKRLVVVLDDVDRLRQDEVADIMRLVRLVGDFPNTLYLLAFDRNRVEQCLGDDDLQRGRAYLEKIVQVTHDVPQPRPPDIDALLIAGLQGVMDMDATGPFVVSDWQNIYAFVIRPLFSTPRDVRRFVQSLPLTLRVIGNEVALADVLGLEAIRVLRPDMFAALVDSAPALGETQPSAGGGFLSGQPPEESPLAALVDVDRKYAAAVCTWLFPAARRYFENIHFGPEWLPRWRSDRRVANPEVFRFYLERRLPDNVATANTVEAVLISLTERDQLTKLLGLVEAKELPDLLARLESPVEDLAFDATQPLSDDPAAIAIPPILDLLRRLPTERPGPLDLTSTLKVGRVALRLLKRAPEEAERIELVRLALPAIELLSGRLALIKLVGHRENVGLGLVVAAEADLLESDLRTALISGSDESLAFEPDLDSIAAFMAETDKGKAALQALAADDEFMLALLVSCYCRSNSWSIGAAAVTATGVLLWEYLITMLGEDLLKQRVLHLAAQVAERPDSFAERQLTVVALAEKYAGGWIPDSFTKKLFATDTPMTAETQPAVNGQPTDDVSQA